MQALTNQHSTILFSAELFSDTSLSQQQTGGVLLHIEDWLAGVQRSSRQKKPLKINQNELNYAKQTQFMPFLHPKCRFRQKTNPIKPNSNPKQTHFQPLSEPPNPKQTQFLPAKLCGGQTQFMLVKLPEKHTCGITKFCKAKEKTKENENEVAK